MSLNRWLFRTRRHKPSVRRTRRVCCLCLLGNGERLQFLQLECFRSRADRERTHQLPRTLPQGASLLPLTHPKPVSQQLSSSHSHVHSIPSSNSHFNTTSSPCSSKRSPSTPFSRLPSAAPMFSSSCSSNQFSSELKTEAEVMLTLLIKLIIGKSGAGWMRVLAMEITRG